VSESEERLPWIAAVLTTKGGALVAVLIWIGWLILGFVFWCNGNGHNAGVFGDWFGSLNVLVSGVGVLFVGATLWNQQQHSLKQDITAKDDRAKDRFHSLLNIYHRVLRQHSYKQLLQWEKDLILIHLQSPGYEVRKPKSLEEVGSIFDSFYENNGVELGHIFRMQIEIVRLIDSHYGRDSSGGRILSPDGQELMSIFKAVLSDPELHLLVYLGLSYFVDTKFRTLIDDHGILDGLTNKPQNKMEGSQAVNTMFRIAEIAYYPKTNGKWMANRLQTATRYREEHH